VDVVHGASVGDDLKSLFAQPTQSRAPVAANVKINRAAGRVLRPPSRACNPRAWAIGADDLDAPETFETF